MSELNSDELDPVEKRAHYIKQVSGLLAEVGISREELDSKINRQLEIEDGIDALSFDGLQKVIAWLESKKVPVNCR